MTAMDDRGRIIDRRILTVLGWTPDTVLTLDLGDGRAIVGRPAETDSKAGTLRVTTAGHLRLPAEIRHWCAHHAVGDAREERDGEADTLVAEGVVYEPDDA